MAFLKHTLPGLANPVYLPDTIKVEVKLITNSRFRSWQKSSSHVKTTWHDTGNPSTDADAEWTWANNGRPGAGVGGYNGIFDAEKLIICQPFDEVVWAAGTAIGNMTSYHFEQAYGGSGNSFAGSLEVGKWVHAAIIVAKGWDIGALVQHNIWYGKNCPAQIRGKGLWPEVVKDVTSRVVQIRAYLAGGDAGEVVKPVYPKPIVLDYLHVNGVAPARLTNEDGVEFIFVGDRVRAIRDTPRYQWAGTKAPSIGPDIVKGEEFNVDWLFRNAEGWWYWTQWDTRIRADDVERVDDAKAA